MAKRTIENCTIIKRHISELGQPLTETQNGKTYCEGYAQDGGEPAEVCKECPLHMDRMNEEMADEYMRSGY